MVIKKEQGVERNMEEELISKFEPDVLKRLDKDNIKLIINFLVLEDCCFIEDMISDYIDLFLIPYKEFVNKYNILNNKYNGNYLEMASYDMNMLEEFYE